MVVKVQQVERSSNALQGDNQPLSEGPAEGLLASRL